jgi:uncharacterized membrane protein
MAFGAVVVGLSFVLSKKLFGRKAAWLTILFVALSPMLIKFGQEARMYTMVAAIVFAATLVLMSAMKTNKRSTWLWYGVLVSLGMWTHYFAIMAWFGHWVWRLIALRSEGKKGKKLAVAFFSKNWLIAHGVAIALFAPWMVALVSQFLTNQQGFWIGPVGAMTPINYLSSMFFYLEGGQMLGWYAVWLFGLVAVVTTLAIRTFRKAKKSEKTAYWLPFVMVAVPPAMLVLASMPPLKSAFVERYLVPALAFGAVFIAVVVAAQLSRLKRYLQIGLVALFVATSIFGIHNVYYYGNYNKNSHVSIQVRQLVEKIRSQAKPGEPLIANSPWVYYEASFYDNDTNPIYFVTDSDVEGLKFGSLAMLKDETKRKITNLEEFTKEHPVVWYFGNDSREQIPAPTATHDWNRLKDVSVIDPVDHRTDYKSAQFRISAE